MRQVVIVGDKSVIFSEDIDPKTHIIIGVFRSDICIATAREYEGNYFFLSLSEEFTQGNSFTYESNTLSGLFEETLKYNPTAKFYAFEDYKEAFKWVSEQDI